MSLSNGDPALCAATAQITATVTGTLSNNSLTITSASISDSGYTAPIPGGAAGSIIR
jgi:hypothetical protein